MLIPIILAATPTPPPFTSEWELMSESLAVSTTCAREVTITEGPGASIRIRAHAAVEKELERLEAQAGETATLGIGNRRCYSRPFHWNPTLRIEIEVPEGISLSIEEGGATRHRVSGSLGHLVIASRGSGDVEIAEAGSAVLRLSASGSVRIDRVHGAANAELGGSGDVTIRSLGGPARIVSTASGAVSIGCDPAGRSGACIPGPETIGDLEILGRASGTVVVGRAQGRVRVETSGSGDVLIGTIVSPDTALVARGSGALLVGPGTIDHLRLAAHGSGDIKVEAMVGEADALLSASGSIHLMSLAGELRETRSGSGSVNVSRKTIR
jgi:hypothetical protein